MTTPAPRTHEQRREARLILNVPTVVEPIAQPSATLHPELARVYERVAANTEQVGTSFPAVLRDLSVAGAFIAGESLPLLTRVRLSFSLKDYGRIEAIAWTLWRRREDCAIPDSGGGDPMKLPRGFGVLFEAIPLEARIAIHNLVVEQNK